jgi:hypothetical protein
MFPSRQQARTLARGLGWFGIGLGVVELLTARPLSRAVGVPRHPDLIGAAGVREIATGIGLLHARDPAPWLWARLAGDALDVATLARGLHGKPRRGATVALAAVAGVALLGLVAARRLGQPPIQAVSRHGWRSGFPLPAHEMRGAALEDFTPPRDMRPPEAPRAWGTDEGGPQRNSGPHNNAHSANGARSPDAG